MVEPHKLVQLLYGEENFLEVIQGINQGLENQLVYGVDGSPKNLLISALKMFTGRPSLVITSDLGRAEKIYNDLSSFFPGDRVLMYPARENLLYDTVTHSKEISEQRLLVLDRIINDEDFLVVAPLASLLPLLPPPGVWKESYLEIKKGSTISMDDLILGLLRLGYERVPLVEGRGQFSHRGGILDFFPRINQVPSRVEFFGDEIDSIREFDPVSQRSTGYQEEAFISPAHEVVLSKGAFQRGKDEIAKELKKQLAFFSRSRGKEPAEKLLQKVEGHQEKLSQQLYFDGIEQYLPFFYPGVHTLLDYLPRHSLVFLDEPVHLGENGGKMDREVKESFTSLQEEGLLLPGQLGLYRPAGDILTPRGLTYLSFSLIMRKMPGGNSSKVVSFPSQAMPSFHGKMDILLEEINQWTRQGYRLVVMASSGDRAREIKESFNQERIPARELSSLNDLGVGLPGIININLDNGFILPSLKIALLAEREIFPPRVKKKFWKKTREGLRISDYQELKIGDYVVHEHHGIGQYLGVRTLEVNGVSRDYLYLKYSGEDKLFIPTDQIDLIRKYIGLEGQKPRLYSLGSNEWNRVKSRVRASVEKMARELMDLYAARQSAPGHAFSPDHPWQKEFEDRFPYVETRDQLKAINDVKGDMEKSRPMDRLVCGDVGYGKTEVALRAAFKAVIEGKQVALLVPTTILAQQHYNSFQERFNGFPLNLAVLSRFKKPAEQKEIIRQVRSGWIDIIIGTHRLLSADLRFKDLGLLIIDEEQRFGVRHKEKLKMMRQEVDVFSMTATPIPRTLHMSLVGVRDLSVIETPPENRYPIQTYVVEYSDALLREAIQREINRGGQVYLVYNRVEQIEKWSQRVKELVPGARVAIAHGQMPEGLLERKMISFLNRSYDILVSTTIVEAGLDIPNVNTIIIIDADKMGLSQLYQLRGRVGRSNRLAYAYLTFQKDKVLSELAEKRLQAIKEFTRLGSGFKVALRDLEIRGAGNILGPEQHGFVAAVGFDMYCQLLESSLKELQGTTPGEERDIKLELDINAYIPAFYISEHSQKIAVYQKIASSYSLGEVEDIGKEVEDRFGPLPLPVQNLLAIARLKVYARGLKISTITREKEGAIIKFDLESFKEKIHIIPDFLQKRSEKISLLTGRHPGIKINAPGTGHQGLLESLEGFCRDLYTLKIYD